MNASIVIGQANLTNFEPVPFDQGGFSDIEDLAIDPTGKLLVLSDNNQHVSIYSPPFSTGMPRVSWFDFVTGQTSNGSSFPYLFNGYTHLRFTPGSALWFSGTTNTIAMLTPAVLQLVEAVPTVTASPTSLSFSYQTGGTTPSPQSITVAGSITGLSFSAAASVLNGGNWLLVSPSAGITPASVTVSVNQSGLTANTYMGTILVTGADGASGSTTISVTLTVTAPLQPTVAAVVNAASFQSGPISPGEIVTIGGTGLGPTTPAGLALDQTGKVATSLGGVQVLFSGTAAPLTYVSATQINCVVPYEIQGLVSPYAQVSYQGQTSSPSPLTPAASNPGIFTANGSGTGPVAALNQDNTYNSPSNPAPKGSYVVFYMTGEGQTSPPGVTGKVTTVSPSLPLTPQPLLKVAVLIGGQPASVAFNGEAPGLVSGVMQINVQIPANAPSGNLPISVSVGGASSQNGVTISVQ
jgi:uncharacterized protein (TIGR03437 family)